MQLVDLASGALKQVDMTGVQRIEFAEHDADTFLLTWKLQPQKTVQRFQFLRARTFDFGVQKLAKVALGHPAGVRHLLQRAAFLANRGFNVIE